MEKSPYPIYLFLHSFLSLSSLASFPPLLLTLSHFSKKKKMALHRPRNGFCHVVLWLTNLVCSWKCSTYSRFWYRCITVGHCCQQLRVWCSANTPPHTSGVQRSWVWIHFTKMASLFGSGTYTLVGWIQLGPRCVLCSPR